jgi:hypothetical protein
MLPSFVPSQFHHSRRVTHDSESSSIGRNFDKPKHRLETHKLRPSSSKCDLSIRHSGVNASNVCTQNWFCNGGTATVHQYLILAFLTPLELAQFSCVNRHGNIVASQDPLWKPFFISDPKYVEPFDRYLNNWDGTDSTITYFEKQTLKHKATDYSGPALTSHGVPTALSEDEMRASWDSGIERSVHPTRTELAVIIFRAVILQKPWAPKSINTKIPTLSHSYWVMRYGDAEDPLEHASRTFNPGILAPLIGIKPSKSVLKDKFAYGRIAERKPDFRYIDDRGYKFRISEIACRFKHWQKASNPDTVAKFFDRTKSLGAYYEIIFREIMSLSQLHQKVSAFEPYRAAFLWGGLVSKERFVCWILGQACGLTLEQVQQPWFKTAQAVAISRGANYDKVKSATLASARNKESKPRSTNRSGPS